MKTLYLNLKRLRQIQNNIEQQLAAIEFELEANKERKRSGLYQISNESARSLIDQYYFLSIQREICLEFIKNYETQGTEKNTQEVRSIVESKSQAGGEMRKVRRGEQSSGSPHNPTSVLSNKVVSS